MKRIPIFLLLIVLTACGKVEVSVQVIEPADATALYNQQATQLPNASGNLFYQHDNSGITFFYPAAWQVQDQPNLITISGPDLRLFIQYTNFAPESPPAQIALSDDNTLTENALIHLLGDSYPTYIDSASQRLYYIPTTPFIVVNFAFSIHLESDNWPLSPQIRQQADSLVESFAFTWLVTRPTPEQLATWQVYHDESTDLQFQYPPDWQVSRTPDTILITAPDAQLVIFINTGPAGLPAGDFQKADPSHIWLNGSAISRTNLIFENKLKSVYYGPPITQYQIADNNLIMIISAPDEIPYDTIDLSPDTLHQFDQLLTTLH